MNDSGTYSPYIFAIEDWLTRNGVRVVIEAHDTHRSGWYNHDDNPTPVIAVCEANAREALKTIAHEAGHWLGYLIDRKPHSFQRERQAYVYGWHVLRWFNAPVTREEWLASCRENENYRRALSSEGAL